MSTKVKLWSALAVVVVVIGALIRTAVTRSSDYYVTVAQLKQEGARAVDTVSTVSGSIVPKSIQWNPTAAMLHFSMQDDKTHLAIPVVFHGTRPDSFSNGWPVIVTGHLKNDGVFTATQLLVKCPSKYEASGQKTYTATKQA